MRAHEGRLAKLRAEVQARQPKPRDFRDDDIIGEVVGRTEEERREWVEWWRLALAARGFNPGEAPILIYRTKRKMSKREIQETHRHNRKALDCYEIEDPEWKDDLRYEGGPSNAFQPLPEPVFSHHNALLSKLLAN